MNRIGKNQYDKTGENRDRGEKAENILKKLLEERGWKVEYSSKNEDMDEHWDLKVEKNGKTYRIDAKAMKKLQRKDNQVQDEWQWIELHGVRKTDKGWLYGGKADLIAFETKHSFLIVKRKDLIKLVAKLVDFNSLVEKSKEAKYKLYQRKNRPDKITLIETEKLKEIAKELKKNT